MLIGGVFNLIGKLFIAVGTAFCGYLIITNVEEYSKKLASPVLPTFVRIEIFYFLNILNYR